MMADLKSIDDATLIKLYQASQAPKAADLSDQQLLQLVSQAQNPAQPASMPWSDVAAGAAKNFIPSAKQFASDMVQPILHPVDTAKTLGSVYLGVLQKSAPGDPPKSDHVDAANAVADFFANRYGGIENIKKTIATDPVGMGSDVATVLSGGALGAARMPNAVGKATSAALRSAADIVDPITLAAKGVGRVAPYIGDAAAQIVGGLGTHTGADSLKVAAKSGYEGGAPAAAFVENLRGNAPMASVIDEAKFALGNMKAQRSAEYRAGMAGVSADKTVLDFTPIDAAIQAVDDVKKYKGVDLSPSAANARQQIASTIDEWKKLDPAEYHTPEGFDALKQKLGDIKDSTEYGTPSRRIADDAYSAVRAEITKQAPEYAKVMKDYETASGLIEEIQKTLSLNPSANVDTTLRKLQSVMRNNVNTNYGRRFDLVNELESAGGTNIMPSLAGQSLNSATPRGLGNITANGSVTAALSFLNPWALATLPLQSPRLMGEAAYAGGRLSRNLMDAADKVGLNPEVLRAIEQANYQGGRTKNEFGRLTKALAQ
jgi:hypothetical protein